MNITTDHELGNEVFFMEDNRVVKGIVQSIQATRNLVKDGEVITNYRDLGKVKRPWGNESTLYAVTVSKHGSDRSVVLREKQIFASREALLETL